MSNLNSSTPTNAPATGSTYEPLGITSDTVASIPRYLDVAYDLQPKLTMCFVGDSGIGKTPIVHAWAKNRGAACHVLNFGHMQAQDVSMALFAPDGLSHRYVPAEWLLRVNADAADTERYPNGAVLFLDEINRAPLDLLNAFFTLPDERRIQDFVLHPNVLIVAAMNPSSDGHTVSKFEKDPAMRKRLCFVHVVEDLHAWLVHAGNSSFSPVVCDFLLAQGDKCFYDRASRAAGRVFATPSAWDKVCRVYARANGRRLSGAERGTIMGVVGCTVEAALHLYASTRVVSPAVVFADGAELQATLDLLASDPNHAKHSTFRSATVAWCIEAAAGNLPTPAIARNFGTYLRALPSDIRQAFFTELGAAVLHPSTTALVTTVQPGIVQLLKDADCLDLVASQVETLTA